MLGLVNHRGEHSLSRRFRYPGVTRGWFVAKALTAKGVEAARSEGKRIEVPDGHTRGLFLIIQPSGVKSWALRYRFEGRPKKLTIGPVLINRDQPDVAPALGSPHTLGEARTAAQMAKLSVGHRVDPAAALKAAKAPLPDPESHLVKAHSNRFVQQYCKPKNRSWRETERQFKTTIHPAIGHRRVSEVTKADIVAIRDGLIEGGKPIMANRVFATLRKFFNWLVGRGVLEASPCAGLSMPSSERSRDRVLSWSEVAAMWTASEELGEPFGALFRALLLSGQRRDEVAALKDQEIDSVRSIWTIPAERAKNGKAHIVPVTDAFVELIAKVKRVGKLGLVFSTTGETPVSGFSRAKARLDDIVKFNEPWTLHDLRRTVATGMAELGEPIHVVEAVLNHRSGTIKGVAAVYNRHDYFEEKARALMAWGRFVSDVVTDDAARLAYGRLKDRRTFIQAIHGQEKGWGRCLKALKQESLGKAA